MNSFFDEIFTKQIGLHVVTIIRRRTNEEGKFLPGSSEGADAYSTKPFVLPLAALSKGLGNKVITKGANAKSKNYDPDNFKLFMSNTGNVWVFVKQGYRKIRELAGKDVSKVSMTWSGRYLRDLSTLQAAATPGKVQIEIGWKSEENKKLARIHEELGAGRSKRKHKILGLTEKELDVLGKEIKEYVMQTVGFTIPQV